VTSRERLLTVIRGGIPDCVPVAPDISNMIPARLTGLPFWDLYLYRKIPIWEAYVAAAKRFGFDSLMDGYFPLSLPSWKDPNIPPWEQYVVKRTEERIVVQRSWMDGGRRRWEPLVDVYYVADSPTRRVPLARLELPEIPERFEPVEGVREVDTGPEGLRRVKELMGDQGLVGVFVGVGTMVLHNVETILDYADNPARYEEISLQRVSLAERRVRDILALPVRPDFICVGGSGTLVFQTPEMFRALALPGVKRAIEVASAAGMPTHVHSCGPEREVVRIMAEETALTVIDPLEIPPMGDCDLADLKRRFGQKLVLKGNLHTTEVMLRGRPEDVGKASRKAIDEAAEGGRFILSTGDQCGRDTPFENLEAMIATARSYGRY
jgi:uroporphyrinogen decarboxylase